MKKILVLINSLGLPHHLVDFALKLGQTQSAKINGLFIDKIATMDQDNYAFPSDLDLSDTLYAEISNVDQLKQLQTDKIRLFEDTLSQSGIGFYVQIIRENSLDTIIDETAFADLILCDDNLDLPDFSMRSFLATAHCPVLNVSKKSTFFSKVIFSYDGNWSSVHAIKQFSYLFSWLRGLRIYLVSILPTNILEMEYDALVREWILLHHPGAEIIVLKGDVKDELARFVNLHENCLLVMGAFGRNALSRFFRESLAPVILDRTQASVFIAHS